MSVFDLDGAIWRMSARSASQGSCVEVASVADATSKAEPVIAVRDSKNRHGPALIFTSAEWAAFTCEVKAGRHDLS